MNLFLYYFIDLSKNRNQISAKRQTKFKAKTNAKMTQPSLILTTILQYYIVIIFSKKNEQQLQTVARLDI